MADFKDTVKTMMQTNALFTLLTFTFVKYDILTEHLTMFWFPMIINEYTAEFQSTKASKDAKFKQCLYVCMYVCKTLFQHAIFVNYLHQLVSTKGVLCTLNLKYITRHTLIKLLITNINLS